MTVESLRDDRKSGPLADAQLKAPAGHREVAGYCLSRDVLRSSDMHQAGVGADSRMGDDPRFLPVFFLDGEDHKRRRQAIARFFTPKAIQNKYRLTMEEVSDQLVADLRASGRGNLDEIAFRLTVSVAGEIVGLTNSPIDSLSRNIQATLITTRTPTMPAWQRPWGQAMTMFYVMRFFLGDVKPAIKARRTEPKSDVISHMLAEGASDKQILIECMTYALAGMVTTRELISMAAWHMFDNEELRRAYVEGTDAEQQRILEEILRLEPVAAMLTRRAQTSVDFEHGSVQAQELVALNLREANLDESAVGACPHALIPDRSGPERASGAYLSFGEGSHRCPGAQVAINESRIFLDRLMKAPGLRLERAPDMTWNHGLNGYELRRMVVSCDRA